MSDIKAVPADNYNGSPIIPTGDPMIDGIGPAAWANRSDTPDMTFHGTAKIVPMRLDPTYTIAKGDPDPRGMPVIAVDNVEAGVVIDCWVNRSEPTVAYYEVQLNGSEKRVLLPVGFVQWPNFGLWGNDRLLVKAITAAQFANVPQLKRDDQITLLEEDKVSAYYAGGHLYAMAERAEPII